MTAVPSASSGKPASIAFGRPGIIHGAVIATSHFVGNAPGRTTPPDPGARTSDLADPAGARLSRPDWNDPPGDDRRAGATAHQQRTHANMGSITHSGGRAQQ